MSGAGAVRLKVGFLPPGTVPEMMVPVMIVPVRTVPVLSVPVRMGPLVVVAVRENCAVTRASSRIKSRIAERTRILTTNMRDSRYTQMEVREAREGFVAHPRSRPQALIQLAETTRDRETTSHGTAAFRDKA